MPRSMPSEVLIQIEAHERWLTTYPTEGKQLELAGADFHELDLSAKSLSDSILPGASFDYSLLRGTDFSAVNLYEASFIEAILDAANLYKADCGKTCWLRASLRDVQAARANFMSADFSQADLTQAHLRKAYLMQANLEQANLTQADLSKAGLMGANLEHANLTGANLQQAGLIAARLPRANFTGARLRNALLAQATGLESVQIAWIDIGEEGTPERLEGALALRWLREEPLNLCQTGTTNWINVLENLHDIAYSSCFIRSTYNKLRPLGCHTAILPHEPCPLAK